MYTDKKTGQGRSSINDGGVDVPAAACQIHLRLSAFLPSAPDFQPRQILSLSSGDNKSHPETCGPASSCSRILQAMVDLLRGFACPCIRITASSQNPLYHQE